VSDEATQDSTPSKTAQNSQLHATLTRQL